MTFRQCKWNEFDDYSYFWIGVHYVKLQVYIDVRLKSFCHVIIIKIILFLIIYFINFSWCIRCYADVGIFYVPIMLIIIIEAYDYIIISIYFFMWMYSTFDIGQNMLTNVYFMIFYRSK